MKRLFVCLMTMLVANLVVAQNDPKAKSILDQVSKKYKSLDVVKVDFIYSMNNPQAKIKESQTGTLIVKSKANKYKLNIAGREVTSDGKTIWSYVKSEKEVQVSDVESNSKAINPAQIFTVYEKGFKCLLVGEVNVQGTQCHQIDLVPLDAKRTYFKIKLSVEKGQNKIKEVSVFDKNGTKYVYTVSKYYPSTSVPDNTFVFDAKQHPNVEVVDMRD